MDSPHKSSVPEIENPQDGLGWIKAACTIAMSCVGVGVLALPRTSVTSGWLGSLIGLGIAVAIVYYTNILLWRTLRLTADNENEITRSYEQAGRATFGRVASIYIGFIIHITLASVCCAMLILLGSTCLAMTGVLNKRVWIVLWTLVGIPFSWIKEIKDVGIVAAIGVLSSSAMVIVIIAASVNKMIDDAPDDLTAVPLSAIDFLSNLATYFFVNGFAASTPTVCFHMNKPEDFPKTLAAAMTFITLVYMTVMELGYAAYGPLLAQVDTIVDALSPPGRSLDVFGWLINIVVLIVLIPHFLVMFTPTAKQMDLLCSNFSERRKWSTVKSKLLCLSARTCLVILEGLIAIVVPRVSSLVSVIGAFCMVQFSIFFPVACYHKIKRLQHLTTPKLVVVFQILIVAIGFVVMVMGLYGSVTRF
ncbi:transmembrane transporter, putative [Perkinsus marinus ATCC 50983]|uniref:Transmembrane transporter, putative n=1 Tax=Perkinsus marinus (strain ATCC 50983 / TXsc) TaxID=423536 RepID=C5KXW3_PERM5|nr:transmembrane transporter, putative [Perkinsus marinus ATCC 50983]EER10837.1 transmembrane transporter, putative [Perkinsus marinus ATCC 50983]|eukprot:XP_002779042.1 transmembrane transporter, putative [Perkinsus marinus ATCC 50983]